jgi:hypothetical protein
VAATLELDIERKLMIDLLPFPVGALLLAFGLYQRNATQDIDEQTDPVLDAELDV